MLTYAIDFKKMSSTIDLRWEAKAAEMRAALQTAALQ